MRRRDDEMMRDETRWLAQTRPAKPVVVLDACLLVVGSIMTNHSPSSRSFISWLGEPILHIIYVETHKRTQRQARRELAIARANIGRRPTGLTRFIESCHWQWQLASAEWAASWAPRALYPLFVLSATPTTPSSSCNLAAMAATRDSRAIKSSRRASLHELKLEGHSIGHSSRNSHGDSSMARPSLGPRAQILARSTPLLLSWAVVVFGDVVVGLGALLGPKASQTHTEKPGERFSAKLNATPFSLLLSLLPSRCLHSRQVPNGAQNST